MGTRLRTITLVALLALAVAACGSDAAPGEQAAPSAPATGTEPAGADGDLVPVKVGAVRAAGVAPAFVAHDKGYFADEGLDVEIELIQSSVDAMALLSSGELDVIFAAYSAGFFNGLHAGLELVAVGNSSVHPPPDERPTDALVISSHRAEEFASGQDLAGKVIATAGGLGSGSAYLIDASLREHGLTLADVEVEPLGFTDMLVALENESVDAAYMTDPFMSPAIDAGDIQIVIDPVPGTSAAGILYGAHFAAGDSGQPFFDAIVRALREDLQGEAWFEPETLAIIAEWTGADAETLGDLPPVNFSDGLEPLPEQLEQQQRTYLEAGVLDYEELIDSGEFVDDTFARNVP